MPIIDIGFDHETCLVVSVLYRMTAHPCWQPFCLLGMEACFCLGLEGYAWYLIMSNPVPCVNRVARLCVNRNPTVKMDSAIIELSDPDQTSSLIEDLRCVGPPVCHQRHWQFGFLELY